MAFLKKTFCSHFLALIAHLIPFFLIVSCSSEPKVAEPNWIHEPTRTVNNGYIVYVGKGEGSGEKAQFKAEGQALEDLANECSMIPKGTRIEDRFSEKGKYEYTSYVKVAVEFKDCDEMKKATDPTEIKRLGNLAFTQQLKRYQDLAETGEFTASNDGVEIEAPREISPPPAMAPGMNENIHFYVVRQYVAYQKEIVVLSPPAAYAPGSPETTLFTRSVTPINTQVQTAEAQNPQLKTQPQAWSQIPDRPKLDRPQALGAQANAWKAQHPPLVSPSARSARPAGGKGRMGPDQNPKGSGMRKKKPKPAE